MPLPWASRSWNPFSSFGNAEEIRRRISPFCGRMRGVAVAVVIVVSARLATMVGRVVGVFRATSMHFRSVKTIVLMAPVAVDYKASTSKEENVVCKMLPVGRQYYSRKAENQH